MKDFFLVTLLTCYMIRTGAQLSLPEKMAFSPPNPWDLNKYLWSQTHPKPSTNDKPILNFEALDNWMELGPNNDLSISRDGKYFAYSIQHSGQWWLRDTLIVQSTDNAWRRSFAGASPGFFTADSKLYVFQDKGDLYFLQTGINQPRCVKGVASYKQPNNGRGEWLAYQLKDSTASLVLEHLPTGTEKRFQEIANYSFDNSGGWLACQLSNEAKELLIFDLAVNKEQRFSSAAAYSFSSNGKALILKTITKTSNEIITAMQYVSLPEGSLQTIWSTTDSNVNVASYSIDGSGKQAVFAIQETSPGKTDQPNNSIQYYRAGMDKAVLKVNNQTTGIKDAGLLVLGYPTFTDNDRYIQFILQPQPNLNKPSPQAALVDVWSYQDSILQSTQPYLLKEPKTYRAVINLETDKLIRLENEYEKLYMAKVYGDIALVIKSAKTILGDRFWEKDYRKDSIWVISLKDGSRLLLPTNGGGFSPFWFSPGGKYLVYFDPVKQCHYFSYNLHTGELVNISAGIPSGQLAWDDHLMHHLQQDLQSEPSFPTGLAAWLESDKGLLIYDNFDIWQLDLTGKMPSVNITNNYGRSHKVLFTLLGNDRNQDVNSNLILAANDTVLLRAYNTQNKHSGFYQKVLTAAGNPTLLSMGPYFFQAFSGRPVFNAGMPPLKAVEVQTWIVKRQAATEAPNYFTTSDFKSFTPLTHLQPHKGYNWLTTELHSFKQLDGIISQGVLYKPENFNPAQKYPVIIAFYYNLSEQPYLYPTPGYIDAPDISNDPAWMVSHGYLVFTPDIHFTQGQWGPSTVNAIDGAARYLGQLPFVDAKHIGACGHSNSGRFGYYLLTHSKSFAAMSLGSGFAGTNIISEALSISKLSYGKGVSQLDFGESGSLGSGLGSLWQHKKTWLDHTAILNADKTQSPLLLFHCKQDPDDFMLAVQLFISLRRLETKAWWLQYDEGYHTIGKPRDVKDFTIRYTQFFDHYLKGAPPPRWMTIGIPNQLKGIENRFELDTEGSCGKDCPICKAHKSGK